MFSSEIEEVHPFTAMKSVDCYEIFEELGHSEQGVIIYKAKYNKTEPAEVSGEVVTIKVFKGQRLSKNVICLARDIEHSRYSDHKNLTKVYCSFLHKDDLWVVMNSHHVACMDRVVLKRFRRGAPEKVLGFVLRECLEALEYLHGHKWMHKNFDLGHVFVDSDDAIRIDLDSLAYDPDGKMEDFKSVAWPGPPPEILLTDAVFEFKSDIWCFGIAALKLALGYIPARTYEELAAFLADWPEKLEMEAKAAKMERKQGGWLRGFGCFFGRFQLDTGEKQEINITPDFIKMVTECLNGEASKRPTARQLMECDFFRELEGKKSPSFIDSLLG